MSERRRARVAEEIQRRSSQFIREELKDPRLGFLTIIAVNVNRDLTRATIYVSVLGDETEQQQTMQALRRASGVIKRDIGDWLRIRTTPDIVFKLDSTVERGTRILQLIDGLEHEEQVEEEVNAND
jgi:ribosome-binding factor A